MAHLEHVGHSLEQGLLLPSGKNNLRTNRLGLTTRDPSSGEHAGVKVA